MSKGKGKRQIEFHRGGSVCMESGIVDIFPTNWQLENAENRSDFLTDNITGDYPICVSGAKVKKTQTTIGIIPSNSLIGDTPPANDNARKKLAQEKFFGSQFTGWLCIFVNARYGMYPKKINLDGSFDVNAEYTQPFDINIQFKDNGVPYCDSIGLYGQTLSPSGSFIFISQAYRIFLGDINNNQIVLREFILSSKGKKITKALHTDVELDSGLTKNRLLCFAFTQLEGLKPPVVVYDFTNENVSNYGSPITFGWHASFQVESRAKQQFAIVLHKPIPTNAQIMDTTFIEITLNHTEILNDDGSYTDSWAGNTDIENAGRYKPLEVDYLWLPLQQANQMYKNIITSTEAVYDQSMVYTFYSLDDDTVLKVHYTTTESQYDPGYFDDLNLCGMPTGAKGKKTKSGKTNGYYIKRNDTVIVEGYGLNGYTIDEIRNYQSVQTSTEIQGYGSTPNACSGTFERKPYGGVVGSVWNDSSENSYPSAMIRYYTTVINYTYSYKTQGNTSSLAVVANDAVVILRQNNFNETLRENTGEANGSGPIGIQDFLIILVETENGDEIISVPSGWQTFQVSTTAPSPTMQVVQNISQQGNNVTVYLTSPVSKEKFTEPNIDDGVWKTMATAGLYDIFISPVLQCIHGIELSVYYAADGIESNHHQGQALTAYHRLVGWV